MKMSIQQPSQYQVNNMEQGDIIFVRKQKLLYRIFRKGVRIKWEQ